MCFNRGHRLLKKAFSYCWLKQGIQGAAFVHVTSLLEAQQIGHLSGWVDADRVRLIPFGFQPDCARDKNSLDRFLARFPELNGRRIILHTARIHAIKRLDWVVEAISLLPREFSDVVLLVAGSDSGYRSVVERAIRNCGLEGRVVFAGFLSDELKEGAFEASSVFVMPSVHENYGFAVVEALAHGVPSVVTRGVASSVYVRDSGAGFVVDDSPTAIAEGLREALSTNLDEVGRKAQEFVRQHLSQESCLDAIDGMYRDSLGNATP